MTSLPTQRAECAQVVHKACHEKVIAKCPGAEDFGHTIRTRNEQLQQRFNIDMPHRFKEKTFKRPTFCDHCGSLLWGIFKQGVSCDVCNTHCHRRCTKFIVRDST